jgi:hypothetical protein
MNGIRKNATKRVVKTVSATSVASPSANILIKFC